MAMPKRAAVTPALSYLEPRAALDWLQKAFGFEIYMLIEDEAGDLVHSEMSYCDGVIMVGREWNANTRSPASIGGKCTQTVHIHMSEDINAHCERARAAGAEILTAPETQFYGDRTYRARDFEGHIWTFGQTVKTPSPAEWDKAMGLKTTIRE